MKSRMLQRGGGRAFAIVFEHGDEVSAGLKRFATEHDVVAASFVGLGAFSSATVAFFDLESKRYDPIEIGEQVEVLSITGDMSRHEGEPVVHAHVVLGDRSGKALGGHLLEAYVRPTLEVVVTVFDEPLEREKDERTGLPLIRLRQG